MIVLLVGSSEFVGACNKRAYILQRRAIHLDGYVADSTITQPRLADEPQDYPRALLQNDSLQRCTKLVCEGVDRSCFVKLASGAAASYSVDDGIHIDRYWQTVMSI